MYITVSYPIITKKNTEYRYEERHYLQYINVYTKTFDFVA